ncbi:retrotransposon protein, putative, ty1-copia subclass [Tanacetum coccineum]|uniref:Retrotransposon protein, putative, ty1-copia subclass n=1 Tax=Tanacetum coccineum TaxID=301880 RepID=A0ABQ5FHI6_9ASTR
MVRSMMNLTTLPLSFWDYALESAIHILNMVPTKKVDKTPYELWYGKVPNLSYLKVCGCEALVKRDTPDKLQQRFVKCIFVGYPKEMMSYYFYFPPKNKIVVASEISYEVEGFESTSRGRDSDFVGLKDSRAPNVLCLNVKAEEHSLGDLNEPTSYKIAMLDSESNKWIDAMNAKIQSMMDNMVNGPGRSSWLRFQQNPGECHWTAVQNILKYLRNTKDMFLVYGGNPEAKLRVDCYCNAGFETDIDYMKSMT